MSVLVREFDAAFNELFNTGFRDTQSLVYHKTSNENEYTLEIPLVGMSKADVKISVEDQILNVVAKKNNNRYSKDFSQSWNLNKDANPAAVSANMENGVLTVKIGRVKPEKKVFDVFIS